MNDHITIPRRAFVSLMSELVGGYPNPDDPMPPGPWDPVIRAGLWQRVFIIPVPWRVFGPRPEPWRVFGPQPEPWSEVMLNPQPLPPRIALAVSLAQMVVQTIIATRETAALMPEEVRVHMHRATSEQLSQFIDECGTKWPGWWRFPPPPPPPWWKEIVGDAPRPTDLVIMGTQFDNAGQFVSRADEALGQEFAEAGARLTEMGLSGM